MKIKGEKMWRRILATVCAVVMGFNMITISGAAEEVENSDLATEISSSAVSTAEPVSDDTQPGKQNDAVAYNSIVIEDAENPLVLEQQEDGSWKNGTMTVSPYNDQAQYTWESSNTAVATVTENGETVEITPVGPGTATITVKESTSGATATRNVIVKQLNYDAITVSVQKGGADASEIMAADTGVMLVAAGTPAAEYCVNNTVTWSSDREDIVSLDKTSGSVTISGWKGDDDQNITFTASAGEITGSKQIVIKKSEAPISLNDLDLVYGDSDKQLSVSVSGAPASGDLVIEQIDGADVATVGSEGNVTNIQKAGTFTVEATYADNLYRTTTVQKEFTVLKKVLTPYAVEGAPVIDKISDGDQGLTEENQTALRGAVSFNGIIGQDQIGIDYIFYDKTDAGTNHGIKYDYLDARDNNTITVSDGQIVLTDDRYELAGGYSVSLKAKIEPIVEAESRIDLSVATTDTEKHGVTFGAGVAGVDGQYWYAAEGVPVTVGEGFGVYKQDNTSAETDGYLNAASETPVYVKDTENKYYEYTLKYLKDYAAPIVNLVSVEVADGGAGSGTGLNQEAVYTISVEDPESGVKQENIQYGISSTKDVNDIGEENWLEPGWEDENTTQFKVTVPANSYLFVRAADCVGNETVNECRALVLEFDQPAVTVTLDGTEQQPDYATDYSQSHIVSVKAEDAADDGTAPYTYSGVKSITLSVEDQNGNVVYRETKENAVPGTTDDLPGVRQLDLLDVKVENQYGTEVKLDGTYTMTVTVADNCGNTTVQKYTLNFDNTAPEYSLSMENTQAANGGNYYAKADTCGLKMTMSDQHLAEGLDYSIKVNGTEVSAGTTTTGEVIVSAEDISNAVDADGTVTVTAAVTDKSGNVQTTYTEVAGMKNGGNAEEASFVLDRTAPVVTGVATVNGSTPLTNKPAYDNIYYYNEQTVAIKVTISDDYAGVEDWSAAASWNGEARDGAAASVEGGIVLTYDLSEEGKYSGIMFTGKDYAGNAVVLDPALNCDPADKVTLTEGTDGNTVAMDHSKVVDKTAPVAEITYSQLESDHVYQEAGQSEDQKTAYYNMDVTATVMITDQCGEDSAVLDDTKLAVGFTQDAVPESTDNQSMVMEKTATWNTDSINYVKVYGADRAGNPLTVVETFQYADGAAEPFEKTTENCSEQNPYQSCFTLVVDKTAPEFVMDIVPEDSVANKAKDSADNRYYFNGGFKAETFVTEENFDAERIKMEKVFQEDSSLEDSSAVELEFETVTQVAWNEGANAYQDEVQNTQDGVNRYRVYGTDKAGNALVPAASGNENLETTAPVTGTDKEETADVSVHVVLDTTAPEITVQAMEKDQTDPFYKAVLRDGNTYNPEINQPYRSATEASAVVSGMDFTPFTMAYSFESSSDKAENQNMEYVRSTYSKDSAETIFKGQQTVRLTSLTATDKAGNTAVAPVSDGAVSNWLYLDVDAPEYDELAPNITMQISGKTEGKAVGGVYGPDGNDLYTSDVTVKVHVQDPNVGNQASGLYKTYYKIEVNGEDWSDRDLVVISASDPVEGTTKTIGKGEISYGTTGSSGNVSGDEVLTYDDEITFTFKTGDFNYNDIKITVWAEDNSGNVIAQGNRVSKAFGVDVTQPTIKVTYDNNNAQNGKYFNANRVATVVVTERNFDAAATKINTPSEARISGWVHEHPTVDNANGDKDTWTCTITYDKDGDYTLDIVTADLAKNAQKGSTDYGDSVAPQDFVLDKTAPVIGITFDNNDVRNGHYYNAARIATITITEHNFSASDAKVDVGASILEGAVVAPGVAGWSSSNDANVGTVSFTADGDYTLKVNFTDLAGNPAEEVAAADFTVDTTAPVLEIGGVENLSANNGVVAPSITYYDINYAADATRISITGYRNTEGKNLTGRAVEDALGGSFICNNIEEIPANDDIYTCTGHVEDMAGNVSEAEIMFSVNRFGSNYILDDATQQLVDEYYTGKAPTIGIREINVDTLEFSEITATYNGEIITLEEGKDYQVEKVGTPASWKEYSYTISSSCFVDDGVYNITVHSRDAAQNENSNRTARVEEYAMPVDFVLDTTNPTVVITGVEPNAQYVEEERLITVLAEDNIQLQSLELYMDDAVVASYDAQQLEENGGKVTYNVSSKNDWQTVTVIARDMAGNEVQSQQVRFLLTTNLLVQYLHNTPAIVITVVAVGCFGFILFGVIKRRKKTEEAAVK